MRLTLIIFGLVNVNFGRALQLPPAFKRCHVSASTDGQQNECLRSAIEGAIKGLSATDGHAELGLVDLDPFPVGPVAVIQPDSSPLAVALNVTDGTVSGFADVRVVSVSGKLSSPKDFKINIKYSLHRIDLKGIYDVSGKIIILPIAGHGKGRLALAGYVGTLTLQGQPKIKNGREYLKITKFDLDYNLTGMKFNIENLFNGNKQLGEIMNQFLDNNWKEFDPVLRPTVKKAFSALFASYAKKIFDNVAFEDVFLVEK